MAMYKEHEEHEVGVIFECPLGIYIGEAVQSLANTYGWRFSQQFSMVMKDDVELDDESYTWAWDEAEEYLNVTLAKDDHYYGSHPMAGCGCWGYWKIGEDEYDILSPIELKYEEAKNWERKQELMVQQLQYNDINKKWGTK